MASKPTGKALKAVLDSVPVDIFNTGFARAYTHIHPALVLAIYYAAFGSIVADPVTSLAYLLLPLSVLQAFYVAACIPKAPDTRTVSSDQNHATSKASIPPRRKPKAAPALQATIGSTSTPALVSIILSLSLTTVPLFIVLVLHGAPLTTHLWHTLVLAAHLALLSTVPLFYAHGVSSLKWRELYSLAAPLDELTGAAIGTMLGAWAGAVPIPLDWDREWQKWPVTVCTGAYGGWALGKLLGGTLLKGKRIEFDD